MKQRKSFAALFHSIYCAALAFGMSQSWAAPTSLELTGLLLDGSGNRITASPYITFTDGIYDSATGSTLLAQLGPENVQVSNGSFLQVFGLDDSLFQSTAYLQVNLNGFDLAPRLGIFFNGSYYVVNGIASGPASAPIFQLYAGTAALAVPEPETYALLLAGLAVIAVAARQGRVSRCQME